MPQPRKYPNNAARQAAYRDRLKRRQAQDAALRAPGRGAADTDGTRSLVARVLAVGNRAD